MNWLSLGKKIATLGATVLGSAVGGPLGGIAGTLVGKLLGVDPKSGPRGIGDAIDALGPDAAKIKLQQIENEHAEVLAQINALQVQTQQTNQTMRVEYGSADPYVRRWRPTWGYVSAAAWGLEALAIMVAVIMAAVLALRSNTAGEQALLGSVTSLVYALAGMWTVALAVLGINMVQRSKDKRTQMGANSTGTSEVARLVEKIPGLGGHKP
jgi:hypothetical protein